MPALRKPLAVAAVAVLLAGALSGCVSVARTTVSRLGIAAYQERGIDGRINDLGVSANVRNALFLYDHTFLADIGVTVYHGDVVLTGAVDSEEKRAAVERLAADAVGVQSVTNDVVVAEPGTVDLVQDTWITTQLETRLIFDKSIDSVNYSVTTVDGTVYVMGVARNADELDRVVAHARDLPHARHVVEHVHFVPPPGQRLAGS